jgi:hypothetical protein
VLQRLPWTPVKPPPPRYRLSKNERSYLVGAIARVLQRGAPTLFQFEATCRHGVRVHLILAAHFPWLIADLTAAHIIDRALHKVGAKRPRFIQGQPGYTELPGSSPPEHHYCAHCGKVMPEGRHMYCSRLCSQRANNERQYNERRLMNQGERDIARKLRQHARKEAFAAGRTFTCAWCGGISTWKPGANPRTYCSQSCNAKARHAARPDIIAGAIAARAANRANPV